MKNLSFVVVLALVASFLFCGCTVTESTSEHLSRIYTSNMLQFRMMMEDIDTVLLLDRPQYTTPWAIRGGLPN